MREITLRLDKEQEAVLRDCITSYISREDWQSRSRLATKSMREAAGHHAELAAIVLSKLPMP